MINLIDMAFNFGLDIGSLLGAITSIGAGSRAHRRNIDLMNKQNAFNAGEAALNRDFQSQEAALARQWQEDFYNQYQSPQAMVHQYEAAGLNPVLATGMPTNTPPSASSAQGSMAQGASAPYLDAVGVMAQFQNLMKLDAEIKNIKADTKGKEAAADKARSDISVNNQNITESQSRISKIIEETKNESEKRGLIVAQKVLANIESQLKSQETVNLSYEEFKLKWEKQFADTYGAYPADNAYQAVQRLLDTILEKSGILRIFGVDR